MRKVAALLLFAIASHSALADWKQDLKDAASQKASGKVAQTLGVPYPPPTGAAVYFINLKNGDTVASPVLVQFGLKNAGVCPSGLQSPDTGHHHLLVDDPQVDYTAALVASDKIIDYTKGQTEATLTLAPGKHTLQLLYSDWKNQAFNPSVQSEKITITVTAAAK